MNLLDAVLRLRFAIYRAWAALRPSPGCDRLRRFDRDLAALGNGRAGIAGIAGGIEVVVPVCNAAAWLEVICDGHAALGLTALYIVDTRSADASLELLRRRGCRVLAFSGPDPNAESPLFDVIGRLRSRWVVRFDDDELPSGGLVRWIDAYRDEVEAPAVGISRTLLVGGPTGFKRTACRPGEGVAGEDRQFRLFRPHAVKPLDAVHRPGIVLGPVAYAPGEATILYVDWIVRSYATRLAKLTGFEAQRRDGPLPFNMFEDLGPDAYRMVPLDDVAAEAGLPEAGCEVVII